MYLLKRRTGVLKVEMFLFYYTEVSSKAVMSDRLFVF